VAGVALAFRNAREPAVTRGAGGGAEGPGRWRERWDELTEKRPGHFFAVQERAAAVGWETERFRTLGEGRREAGDRDGAVEAFAAVAADPGTPAEDADSLRRSLEVRPARWSEAYAYTNLGYSLLGAVVEVVTGTPYEPWIREHLFRPAGMYETGYRLPGYEPARVAAGYRGAKHGR
jgi:hypothetical protein